MSKPQALVTGGTRGIGKAICLKLAENGYDIAFTYKSSTDTADALVKELKSKGVSAAGYKVNMASSEELETTLEKIMSDFPQIEVLVNNAGYSKDGLTLRYSVSDWDEIFNINVRAAFLCAQALLKPMMKARKGSIIFLGSIVGETGNAGQVAYSSSKAAILGMMRSMAQEMASRNIRINAITPGFIQTDMTESLPEKTKESILSQIPLGHFGTPEDVADAVLFLANPSSRYITGQVLRVNGGMGMF